MTEYAAVTTQDLITFAQQRDNRTSLEVELAFRLEMAQAMLKDLVEEEGPPLRLVL
jgi:hypothetical protein